MMRQKELSLNKILRAINQLKSICCYGDLFIELQRHVEGLGDINEEESAAIGQMLRRISKLLKEHYAVEHVYAHVIGDNVPHLHIHIIPRYTGAPREFWGTKTNEWPDAPRGGKDKVIEYCREIRNHLKKVQAEECI